MKNLLFTVLILLINHHVVGQSDSAILHTIITEYEEYQEDLGKMRKDMWPDISMIGMSKHQVAIGSFLKRLSAIDASTLDPSDKINLELLSFIIQDIMAEFEQQSYLFPLSAEGGFLIGVIYQVQHVGLHTAEQRKNYLGKLEQLPTYFDGQIDHLRTGLKSGKTMPKLVAQNCLDVVNSYLSSGVNDNVFYKSFNSQQIEDSAFKKDLLEIIANKIQPAYKKVKAFLEKEYLPNTRAEVGILNNHNGRAYYEQRLKYYTTLDLTPEEVFQTGQKEVARIKSEMLGIIRKLEFKGNFDDFLEFLRSDPRFYPKSGDELLYYAAWLSKKIEAKIPELIGHIPRMPFTVKPVPASIAENYTAGRYSGGSYHNKRAGQYWVNTTKLDSRPLYALPALTLHEAVPGHHLQGMLAQEMKDVPAFRKNTYLSAYGEGWGLYSEYLGIEAGMYEDPYDDFGRLTYEMWRACRLVVDVGMHYKNWSREKAVEFMAANTALSLHEVNTEINRYIGWPAQALSYKIGELKIKALRTRCENKLGDDFDLREFHDKILENGSVLLTTLESIIDHYIEEKINQSKN